MPVEVQCNIPRSYHALSDIPSPSPHSTGAGRVLDPVEKPCRVDLYPGRELGTNCPTTPHHLMGVDLVEWYGSYKFKEEIRPPALFRRRSKQTARTIRELLF